MVIGGWAPLTLYKDRSNKGTLRTTEAAEPGAILRGIPGAHRSGVVLDHAPLQVRWKLGKPKILETSFP